MMILCSCCRTGQLSKNTLAVSQLTVKSPTPRASHKIKKISSPVTLKTRTSLQSTASISEWAGSRAPSRDYTTDITEMSSYHPTDYEKIPNLIKKKGTKEARLDLPDLTSIDERGISDNRRLNVRQETRRVNSKRSVAICYGISVLRHRLITILHY